MGNFLGNDTKYSDVIFQVEGQEFFGHKVILSLACQYFENMFESKDPFITS